ncbi:hypothetical protein CR194_16210 [Salipaludibacillus keqinensis]|uniref:YtxH domain-containing protein n=1 Tax=Salipaludibacillus keqinensis TaxID=2045207 RepID=A0A323TIA1_9BACI|nr:hypothetical protein [Salipaludibacillus keqinensis]PYZ92373.1 hypothetical protein CR194_16210 [Salipaludibacillus keqinensis]
MENQTKKWAIGGSIVGVLAGTIYIASNNKARTGVVDFVSSTTNQTKHWVKVINENRDTVVDQIRSSGEKISAIVESASDDIEKLMESSQNMKAHVFDLLEAVQDSTNELKDLKNKLQQGEAVETEALPTPDEELRRIE